MNAGWYYLDVSDAIAAVRKAIRMFPSTRIVEHDVLIGNAHNGGDGKRAAGLLGGCSAPAAAVVTFARRDQLFGGAT
jgi:NAD(P)H-hydrate repair Nnr-like enzyme with NAD(P)H-hydrate epimerase domain